MSDTITVRPTVVKVATVQVCRALLAGTILVCWYDLWRWQTVHAAAICSVQAWTLGFAKEVENFAIEVEATTQSNDQSAPTQSNDQSTQSNVNDQPATKFDNELSALGLLWLQNMSYTEFTKLHTSNRCTHSDSDGTELKLASHFELVRNFAKQFSEADFAELRKKATELSTEGLDDWEVTQRLRDVTVKREHMEQQYNYARGRKSGRIFATNGGVQGFSKVVRAILTAHLARRPVHRALVPKSIGSKLGCSGSSLSFRR